MRRLRAAAVAGLALGFVSCATMPFAGPVVSDCPGQWVDSREIEGEFLLQQRVVVERGDWSFAIQLVTQKRDDELLVVGMHPLGAKLFTVRQRGTEIDVEAVPAAVLEVPPQNYLRDLHRERFLSAGIPEHGVARTRRAGTEIRDRYDGDVLRARSFERIDADPVGIVQVGFGAEDLDAPSRVVIDNGWCGYRAEITLLSERSLP